jgi:phosphoadenosine phosphosulfate reductase
MTLIKISPVFYWTDADMEAYLEEHNLLNEWDYFDPTKVDEKRECGIHVKSLMSGHLIK